MTTQDFDRTVFIGGSRQRVGIGVGRTAQPIQRKPCANPSPTFKSLIYKDFFDQHETDAAMFLLSG
jgi:hypothetical protein